MACGLTMRPSRRIRDGVLLGEDDVVAKQLTAYRENLFVRGQPYEGVIVGETAPERFVLPDFGKRVDPSGTLGLFGQERVDASGKI